MSSSIEEEFSPPDWATREDVIKVARHFINYWRVEARHRNAQWLDAMERNSRLTSEIHSLKHQIASLEASIISGGAIVPDASPQKENG